MITFWSRFISIVVTIPQYEHLCSRFISWVLTIQPYDCILKSIHHLHAYDSAINTSAVDSFPVVLWFSNMYTFAVDSFPACWRFSDMNTFAVDLFPALEPRRTFFPLSVLFPSSVPSLEHCRSGAESCACFTRASKSWCLLQECARPTGSSGSEENTTLHTVDRMRLLTRSFGESIMLCLVEYDQNLLLYFEPGRHVDQWHTFKCAQITIVCDSTKATKPVKCRTCSYSVVSV